MSETETPAVRLNKAIADSGLCARRKADALISAGRVSVNNETITTLGLKVTPADIITVDGQPLPVAVKHYLAFHKPTGYVTSREAQGLQKTFYELLPEDFQTVDPAGRLDLNSSGLLILSSDGHFLQTITHPKYHWEKVYQVRLSRPLTEEAIIQLRTGILLQPENKLAQVKDLQPVPDTLTTYQLTLITGYNRQIRRSMTAIGHRIEALHRLSFGPVQLADLPEGECRPLTDTERASFEISPS